MPHYVGDGSAGAILQTLGEALDLMDIGILLLDDELRVRFVTNRQAEIFGLTEALLASGPTFRDLLEHAARNSWFPVSSEDLPDYIDRREMAVRAGAIPPTRITLRDGRQLLHSCFIAANGGRVLSYVDISKELQREANEATELAQAEMRFKTETLEEQAAHLASLAEIADQNAREVEDARKELECRIAKQMEMERELRRLATTDALTGALNRAGFLTLAQQRLEQSPDASFTVLMLDIDHFKRINDGHGHAAGDRALQHFVASLRSGMRDTDPLGRLGGEEFAVLIATLPPERAVLLAERLRTKVAESPIPFENEVIEITVSIGLADRRSPDDNIEKLIARADSALYQAKRGGRNRVVQYLDVAAA